MAVIFKTKPSAKPVPKKSGHTIPKAPAISLDQPGRLRVAHLLAVLGVSHSTLYSGIKSGRYPKPDAYDGKLPVWQTHTIKNFLMPGGA